MDIWAKAFQVFLIGFSGVFICLIILQFSIIIFSKTVQAFEKNNSNKSTNKTQA